MEVITMADFKELKVLAEEKGNNAMKELLSATEAYLNGLDKIFFGRNVSESALTIDLGRFPKELERKGYLNDKKDLGFNLFLLNILLIARHTWSMIDEDGRTKTGDDLHRAFPPMFGDDQMLDTKALFEVLENMTK
ncbi:MAG: hypothetical protein PF549_01455 [Patescibacteria group bacterium]|jgi:hypothetical protein|nr:hypothetical protein [Patescibacteria group bacterium]